MIDKRTTNYIKVLVKMKSAPETFNLLREMEKTPHKVFVCLNGTRSFDKEERMWRVMNGLTVR